MKASSAACSRSPGPRARVAIAIGLALVLTLQTDSSAGARPKRLAAGLMTHGLRARDWPSLIDVWVPNVAWRDLQPKPGVLRKKPIRDLIERARAAGNVLRLRIRAGGEAPDWVKKRFGTVRVYDPIDGLSAVVPRWWVPRYMDAYRRLQVRLADRYDGNPTIRAVTVSGAMTIYAEPFIRGMSDSRTRASLRASSYTKRKDKRALLGSVKAHRPWKRTRQILTVNPWQYLDADGSYGSRTRFTNRVMDRFRSTFGRRAILQNNSMRSSWLTDHMPWGYEPMFKHMSSLGPPISFQTARTFRVGDLPMVLEWCLEMGAHGVELKAGATDQLTNAQARAYDEALEGNG
jgi:hypothetical protein